MANSHTIAEPPTPDNTYVTATNTDPSARSKNVPKINSPIMLNSTCVGLGWE